MKYFLIEFRMIDDPDYDYIPVVRYICSSVKEVAEIMKDHFHITELVQDGYAKWIEQKLDREGSNILIFIDDGTSTYYYINEIEDFEE